MDYQIDKQTWARALMERYPTLLTEGQASFRDARYRTMEAAEAARLYDEFHPWARAILEPYDSYRWIADKGDCDFWTRLFIAYVLLRNAMGQGELKPALAEIHFRQRPADPWSGHALCSGLAGDGMAWELDPQPDCGLLTLTMEQAATCNSFDA
jgi:hypothetical protein